MKYLQFLLLGLLIPTVSFSQEFTIKKTPEEIKREKELKEEQGYLKFQDHFFTALQEKAGEDYNKAIEALEDCKQIYPDDVGMNFEFAKNYLLLKDYENAIFFDTKVLKVKPNNIHVLEHLKKVYRIQQNINEAIRVQKQIVTIKPNRIADLVTLYISNRERDKAKKILLDLKKKNRITGGRLAYYERILFPKQDLKKSVVKARTKKTIKNPIVNNSFRKVKKEQVILKRNSESNTFKKVKNSSSILKKYEALKKLLIQENKHNNFTKLDKDSQKGLEIFPAQPFLYFMQAKAQNKLKNYKNAIETLDAGLDFIIDNSSLEANFYEQFQKAYSALGKSAEAAKYKVKAARLRNKN